MKYLLTFLILSGISCRSVSHVENSAVSQNDSFEEALGINAQGLLVFDDGDLTAGVQLLIEAIQVAPDQKEFIDDLLFHINKKVLKESFLNAETSDYEKLHQTIIAALEPIAFQNSHCDYITLKTVESYLALNQAEKARKLIINNTRRQSPWLMMAVLKLHLHQKDERFIVLLEKILEYKAYKESSELQHFAMRALIDLEAYERRDQILAHSLQIIENLPLLKKDIQNKMCLDLIDGVLIGSDIGNSARQQSLEYLDPSNIQKQWSLLAGILMKLELFEEAYIVIKQNVLASARNSWKAMYNMARCSGEIGRQQEKARYLERAVKLRPDNDYLNRLLIATQTTNGNGHRALELLGKAEESQDTWLIKMKFYTLKRVGQMQSAFEIAESIYNWSDYGLRINAVTPTFVYHTVEVYQALGRPGLLLTRLKEAVNYNKGDINLYNTVAYTLAEENRALDWAAELMEIVYKAQPQNPSYLDTIAWLKYKQKEYKQAINYINEAIKLDQSQSAVLLLHAGFIYAANGFTDRADDYWQRALAIDPTLKDRLPPRSVK